MFLDIAAHYYFNATQPFNHSAIRRATYKTFERWKKDGVLRFFETEGDNTAANGIK